MTVIWLETDKTSLNVKVQAHGRISPYWKNTSNNNDMNSNHIYSTPEPKAALPISI